jgi:hypothetical protein
LDISGGMTGRSAVSVRRPNTALMMMIPGVAQTTRRGAAVMIAPDFLAYLLTVEG